MRIDYYHVPHAPTANSIVVGGSAVVPDGNGRLLLQRRADNGQWALPGGRMDVGETFGDCVVREVKEETGFDVVIDRIIGIYSDPRHVFTFRADPIASDRPPQPTHRAAPAGATRPDAVQQQFNICCACRILGGAIAVSEESTAVGFFELAEIEGLDVHPSHRIRIDDFLADAAPFLR